MTKTVVDFLCWELDTDARAESPAAKGERKKTFMSAYRTKSLAVEKKNSLERGPLASLKERVEAIESIYLREGIQVPAEITELKAKLGEWEKMLAAK